MRFHREMDCPVQWSLATPSALESRARANQGSVVANPICKCRRHKAGHLQVRVAVGKRSTCVLKEAPLNKGPLGFPQILLRQTKPKEVGFANFRGRSLELSSRTPFPERFLQQFQAGRGSRTLFRTPESSRTPLPLVLVAGETSPLVTWIEGYTLWYCSSCNVHFFAASCVVSLTPRNSYILVVSLSLYELSSLKMTVADAYLIWISVNLICS